MKNKVEVKSSIDPPEPVGSPSEEQAAIEVEDPTQRK
jgi:hypothetical protein